MIILRQKEFGNPINKRKRKEWEAKEGKKVKELIINNPYKDGQFENPHYLVTDPKEFAKGEIKLAKGGASHDMFADRFGRPHGESFQLGNGYLSLETSLFPDNDVEKIPVKEDEVYRKLHRDKNNYKYIEKEAKGLPINDVNQAINERAERIRLGESGKKINKYIYNTKGYGKALKTKKAVKNIGKKIIKSV